MFEHEHMARAMLRSESDSYHQIQYLVAQSERFRRFSPNMFHNAVN